MSTRPYLFLSRPSATGIDPCNSFCYNPAGKLKGVVVMKVTKEEIWWEFTCKVCGSVCQAEPADARWTSVLDYEGDDLGCREHFVECGKCGGRHKIPSAKLTPYITKLAKKAR